MGSRKLTELDRCAAGPGLELLIELQKDIPEAYSIVDGTGALVLLLADCVARLQQQVNDLDKRTVKVW